MRGSRGVSFASSIPARTRFLIFLNTSEWDFRKWLSGNLLEKT